MCVCESTRTGGTDEGLDLPQEQQADARHYHVRAVQAIQAVYPGQARLLSEHLAVVAVHAEEIFGWSEDVGVLLDEAVDDLVDGILLVAYLLIEVKVDVRLVWLALLQV